MERSSNKHGPRLDEQLARESESIVHGTPESSRVEEFRQTEEPAVDEQGLPVAPVVARRELSRHLDAHVFPTSCARLLENAAANEAPDTVLELLRGLNPETVFGTAHEVWQAVAENTAEFEDSPSELAFEMRAEGRRSRPGEAKRP
jgi:hypothetical protein